MGKGVSTKFLSLKSRLLLKQQQNYVFCNRISLSQMAQIIIKILKKLSSITKAQVEEESFQIFRAACGQKGLVSETIT